MATEDAQNIMTVAKNRSFSIRLAGSSAVNQAQANMLSQLGSAGASLARGVQYAADRWG